MSGRQRTLSLFYRRFVLPSSPRPLFSFFSPFLPSSEDAPGTLLSPWKREFPESREKTAGRDSFFSLPPVLVGGRGRENSGFRRFSFFLSLLLHAGRGEDRRFSPSPRAQAVFAKISQRRSIRKKTPWIPEKLPGESEKFERIRGKKKLWEAQCETVEVKTAEERGDGKSGGRQKSGKEFCMKRGSLDDFIKKQHYFFKSPVPPLQSLRKRLAFPPERNTGESVRERIQSFEPGSFSPPRNNFHDIRDSL